MKGTPKKSGRRAAQLSQRFDYLLRKVKANAEYKTYQGISNRNFEKSLEAKNRTRKLKSNFIQKYSYCIIYEETYVLAEFSQLLWQNFYIVNAQGYVKDKFRTQTKFPKKFLV